MPALCSVHLPGWLAALASSDLCCGNHALFGIAALKDILAITEDAFLAIFLSVAVARVG